MVNKGPFKIEWIDNNKKKLKESKLIEVSVRTGKTDLVPFDKKYKFCFEMLECVVCDKEVIYPVDLFLKGYRHMCFRHSK